MFLLDWGSEEANCSLDYLQATATGTTVWEKMPKILYIISYVNEQKIVKGDMYFQLA